MTPESDLEFLVPSLRAKGNGLVSYRKAEDGRLVPFVVLPVRFAVRR